MTTTQTRQSLTTVRAGRGTVVHMAYPGLSNRTYCGAESTQRGHAPLTPVDSPVTCKRCQALVPSQVEEAPATTTGREPRTWDATTAETHTCAGACGRTLPAKSFPTTGKPGRRGVVCRADRDAARSAV